MKVSDNQNSDGNIHYATVEITYNLDVSLPAATLHIKSFKGGNFCGSSLKAEYVQKIFTVENLRPGGTMVCVVSGQHRYS